MIVALPTATAVARPVGLTMAMPVEEELHVAELVTFCVLLSERWAVAVNCRVVPFAMLADDGDVLMLWTVVLVIVIDACAEKLP